VTPEEFEEKYALGSLFDSYKFVEDSMTRHLREHGRDTTASESLEVLLSGEAVEMLVRHTTAALVKRDLAPTNGMEMKRFLAHTLLRSRYRVSTSLAWEMMGTEATRQGITLMDQKRYNNLLTCLRGYALAGREGDDGNDSWMRRKNLLRRLNPLERAMYKNTMALLFNYKNGVFVLDDELQAWRGDAENKMVSARKTGKQGIPADCLADSLIGILYGMRLRVAGESQKKNVDELMKEIPQFTSAGCNPSLASDRGYTTEASITNPTTAKFSSVGICNDASRNPFIPEEAAEDQKQKWKKSKKMQTDDTDNPGNTIFDENLMDPCMEEFKDWIVDSAERLGSDVRVATKVNNLAYVTMNIWYMQRQCIIFYHSYLLEHILICHLLLCLLCVASNQDVKLKDGDNEYTVKVTAYAVRDKLDRKTATKDLFFFSTGESMRKLAHVWVAMPGNTVTSDHLFSVKPGSPARVAVEGELRLSCRPLTVGQRCADWFLLKWILSGTNSGILYSKAKKLRAAAATRSSDSSNSDGDDSAVIDNTVLSELFEKCCESWFDRMGSTKAMAEGTANEEPTADYFAASDECIQFFEVGLLQSLEHEILGVSPDGIAVGEQ
jgi:hypothetical protein